MNAIILGSGGCVSTPKTMLQLPYMHRSTTKRIPLRKNRLQPLH